MEELILVPGFIKGSKEGIWGAVNVDLGELLVYGICNSKLVLQGKVVQA